MVMRTLFLVLLVLLAVQRTAQADEMRLRIVMPDAHPVAGEMIPVTIRGEYAQQINLEELEVPTAPGYDWIQLARDRWAEERIDGKLYKVFERKLAVFSQAQGTLTLGPLTHRLTISVNGAREGLDVVASPVEISVAPYPGEGKAFAASSLTLKDELSADPGRLRDGETLIRKVTLTARGALSHRLPERPRLRMPWLITFSAPETRKTYPTPEGPVSTVTWEWHLRPKTGEPGVLPQIPIPWFDTTKREMKTAYVQAIPFGYASFSDNIAGASALSWMAAVKALLVFVGAALVGLGWLLPGYRLHTRDQIRKAVLRMMPDPTIRTMKAAARAGDLMALRAAGEAHLERNRALGRPVSGDAMKALDERLFAADQKTRGRETHEFDTATFFRQLDIRP